MSTATALRGKPIPPFPADAVQTRLRDELIGAVQAEARRKGEALPKNRDEIALQSIEIDSLTVVELLCAVHGILPFQVGENVVRAGGYLSIDDAVKHVVERIEQQWRKHHNGGKT